MDDLKRGDMALVIKTRCARGYCPAMCRVFPGYNRDYCTGQVVKIRHVAGEGTRAFWWMFSSDRYETICNQQGLRKLTPKEAKQRIEEAKRKASFHALRGGEHE